MLERRLSEVTSPVSRKQTGFLKRTIGSIVEELRFVAGGVPENAWSKEDRERMAKGELPEGHPEHPNV